MEDSTFGSKGNLSKAEYGSDLVVDLMHAFGIEYVALNPGASFRWLHDSLVNFGGNKKPNKMPEVITCTHEETSVAIAHGYAKAKGKPMAVVCHNVVGLQHATNAIFNAWCDRVPIIVLGGTGYMDHIRRRPIEWHHSALLQGNIVRDIVKWDDQPFSIGSIPESFIRGYRIATTEPQGPVYICYDADIQAPKIETSVTIPDLTQYPHPSPQAADQGSIDQIAQWLIEAENPVIIADYVGRTIEGYNFLIELAELLSVPVIDIGGRHNFPSNHPLDLTGSNQQLISQADFILGLDVRDLYENTHVQDMQTGRYTPIVKSSVKIAHISLWDQRFTSLIPDLHRSHPMDLFLPADTTAALPQLINASRLMLDKEQRLTKEKILKRLAWAKDKHNSMRAQWLATATSQGKEKPIALSYLANELWGKIKDEDWALVNGSLRSWPRQIWDFTNPSQHLGESAGGGLGYGIGASIGAALALKDKGTLCVNFQSDGDMLYTDSALWTAAHHQIPLLSVTYNNRSYYNDEAHQYNTAIARNRDPERRGIGIHLRDPEVNFAQLAMSMGVYGEGPIESPTDIGPALERAIQIVKEEKRPALVDIICQNN